MVKTKKTKMKFKGFEITNAIETKDTLYPLNYNAQLMDLLFNSILLIDVDKRKFVNDEVSFNLLDYKQTSNINIMRGIFSTARHGIVKRTIDIETQVELQEITPQQGVKNEITFTLDKRTGLLLIQEDKLNHVLSRSTLKSFLYQHRQLIYPYIDEFNKLNKEHDVKIHKRSFYAISALPPIDFFEKLKEFQAIKSGILYINSSERIKSVDVVDDLQSELNDYNISKFDLEIKIKNKSPLGMIKAFKAYFEKMNELQKYDSYAIEGLTKSGTVKKITPDSITREFEAEIEVNNKGLYNVNQILNEMEDIIINKNPIDIRNTRRLDNSFLLKDVKNVEKAIKEIADSINKPKEGKEETTERKAE